MAEEQRPGDWTHKQQRERTANDIVRDPNEKKWYRQTFWIIFFLLVFWPVGIVLAWKSDWPVVAKVAASVFVVVAVWCSYTMSTMVATLPA